MNHPVTFAALDCDDEGFLNDPSIWDLSIAEQLASMHGIDRLDATQWALITTLRHFYFSYNHLPPPRRICHAHDLANNCISMLFDNHGIEAWRIAGLPNPGEEVKSYM
ncbi:MAG TPA: TusE/DsrC/DsvC family sulfur relay protein [Gammaproteobacteria bacterium]